MQNWKELKFLLLKRDGCFGMNASYRLPRLWFYDKWIRNTATCRYKQDETRRGAFAPPPSSYFLLLLMLPQIAFNSSSTDVHLLEGLALTSIHFAGCKLRPCKTIQLSTTQYVALEHFSSG